LAKAGVITAARVVQEADDLTIISASGVALRTRVKDVTRSGRSTRGVKLMNVEGNDYVASVARTAAADLRQAVGGDGREAAPPPEAVDAGQANRRP
jgi:DNA gyrase/topoisomerase IV subunit A